MCIAWSYRHVKSTGILFKCVLEIYWTSTGNLLDWICRHPERTIKDIVYLLWEFCLSILSMKFCVLIAVVLHFILFPWNVILYRVVQKV